MHTNMYRGGLYKSNFRGFKIDNHTWQCIREISKYSYQSILPSAECDSSLFDHQPILMKNHFMKPAKNLKCLFLFTFLTNGPAIS